MNNSEPAPNPPRPDSQPLRPSVRAARGLGPRLLFGGICALTLAAFVWTWQSRQRLQEQVGQEHPHPAEAERAQAARLIPPPVPDEENFVATPFFASLFDRPRHAEDGRWPDDFSRADQWPRQGPTLAQSAVGRKTGRLPTDLLAWSVAFEKIADFTQGPGKRAEIPMTDAPEAATNAAAALAVLQALQVYEPVLNELRAANARPGCRFKVDYTLENPWAILLPHLAVVKRTCQLMRLKCSAELAAGQAEQGWRDVMLMLRLVDSPKEEPMLLSHLVRVACFELSLQPIWEGLSTRRWNEPQLQILQAGLARFNFLLDLERALQSERAWGNVTIGLARDQRTPHFLSSIMGDDKAEAWVQEADRAMTTASRSWFDEEQKNLNRLFDERILAGFDPREMRVEPRVARENAHFLEQTLRDKSTLVQRHLVFVKALLIAPAHVHWKLASTQGNADLALVACALERYRLAQGRFPDQLSALAPRYLQAIPNDRVTGQPLHYQLQPNGQFLLYSVGWNETDDAGEPAFLASGRGTERKEGDWVWRYP